VGLEAGSQALVGGPLLTAELVFRQKPRSWGNGSTASLDLCVGGGDVIGCLRALGGRTATPKAPAASSDCTSPASHGVRATTSSSPVSATSRTTEVSGRKTTQRGWRQLDKIVKGLRVRPNCYKPHRALSGEVSQTKNTSIDTVALCLQISNHENPRDPLGGQ